jgi:Tfp pilus assembly protein PilF
MRALPHGARPAHIPLRVCARPDAFRAAGAARGMRPRTMAAIILLAASAGFSGCNTMSGGINNQFGMWNYQQGNYVAAREEFYRAVADDPQNASYTYNLACALKRQGDFATAEETYRHALQIDPSHQPSYHGLAQLMLQEGRRDEATELLSTWAKAQPLHPGAHIEMAWVQRENGDLSGAEQSLYHSLAASPNNPIATAQLGQLYQDMGRSDRAAIMFRRSLQADWMQPQVQSRLATLQNPNGYAAAPGTMFPSDGSVVATIPFPASAPLYTQEPSPARTVLAPSPRNDDPAHMAN